jgi:hypothetical protein
MENENIYNEKDKYLDSYDNECYAPQFFEEEHYVSGIQPKPE